MTNYTLRSVDLHDQSRVVQLLTESWGSPRVVVGPARVHDASPLLGLIASQDGDIVGLLTYPRRRRDRGPRHPQRLPCGGRRGYRLRELRVGAIEAALVIKPQIPLIGNHGIPVRDELEMESLL